MRALLPPAVPAARLLAGSVLAGSVLAGCAAAPTPAPAPAAPSPSLRPAPAQPLQAPAPWPAPGNAAARAGQAGLSLSSGADRAGFRVHLDVLVDGAPVPVPAGLGVAGDRRSPVHTDDGTGLVHVRPAPGGPAPTLGQLFTLWGVYLGPGAVGAYQRGDRANHQVDVFVDGARVGTDPARLALVAHQEVAVVVTSPGQHPSVPAAYPFPAGS